MATVILYNVPWRQGGNDFPALLPASLISSLSTRKWTGQPSEGYTVSYVKGGYFEIPAKASDVESAVNYCCIQQDGHTRFAFVDRVEWTNGNSCRCYYTIDNVSTYMTQAIVNGYRTRRLIDVDNRPTSILTGDFSGNYRSIISKKEYTFGGGRIGEPGGYYILIYLLRSLVNLDVSYGPSRRLSNTPTSTILVMHTGVDLFQFLNWLETDTEGEKVAKSITNAYAIPYTPNLPVSKVTLPNTDYTIGEITENDPIKIDTFTLSTENYPLLYNDNDTKVIISMDGSQSTIKVSELIDTKFDTYLSLGGEPSYTICPHWKDANKTKNIHYGSFPQVPLTVDQYNWWQQQNKLGMIAGVGMSAVTIGISAATGNVVGVVGGVAGAAATVANYTQQSNNAERQSPFSTAQNSNAIQSVGDAFLSVMLTGWQNGTTAGIAYYRREGFPCFDYGAITINMTNPGGASYDYYKCTDFTVAGVPAEAQREISAALERGVRLWNTANIS